MVALFKLLCIDTLKLSLCSTFMLTSSDRWNTKKQGIINDINLGKFKNAFMIPDFISNVPTASLFLFYISISNDNELDSKDFLGL